MSVRGNTRSVRDWRARDSRRTRDEREVNARAACEETRGQCEISVRGNTRRA